jgi:1A family penicillin-binding protein
MLQRLQRRRLRNVAALVVFSGLAVFATTAVVSSTRYSLAVYRLKRGLGDTTFHDARGRAWFRMDEQRRDVPLADISPHLRRAVLAIEDHRFYRHVGIDPLALGRAVLENVRAGGAVQGGSTLTQQLARTLFLSNVRSFNRKLKEALLALAIERELTKDQILELYLNRVYLSAGVYGVEPMARKLFGKPARDLSLAESALIAGLIRAPSALSPWSNLDGASRRSRVVLRRMREEHLISAEQEQAAVGTRLAIRPYSVAETTRAGYAKDYLRQRFRDRFGGDHPPDWRVETTFDQDLQALAERAVSNGLGRLGIRDLQAALVAIDPATGDILALVGGRDYRTSTFNRAVRSRRQPGSAFKPFVFAAALEAGWSPVSTLIGLRTMAPQGPEEWTPRNASGAVADELTLRAALLESNNRAAVALQQRIGSRPVLRLAQDAGLADMPDVPSLALGSGLASPLAVTAAYAAFANGGMAPRPRAIRRVLDAGGGEVLRNDVEAVRVISEQAAFQTTSMLRDVVERGTGSGVRARGIRFQVAGKTGTTNEFKDAWFVGYTTSIVAGVWVGRDQPAPISREAYGARLALPIWAEFMARAAATRPPGRFAPPGGLREEAICRVSYLRPVDGCPVYTEYFKEGDPLPSRTCPVHRGSLRQRVERAVEGAFRALGRKLRGIFR